MEYSSDIKNTSFTKLNKDIKKCNSNKN